MARRIMTEKDKREYEKRVSGKVSLYTRYQTMHKVKRGLFTIIAALAVMACIAGVIYLMVRPMRIRDVIGHRFSSVVWSDGRDTTAEEVKAWKVERAYPGSIGNNAGIECRFYDKDSEPIGSITLVGHDNLFVYEGAVYRYE